MRRVLIPAAALLLILTGCTPAEPTLEDAGKACVEYQKETLGIDDRGADTMCEADYDRMGEEAFIEEYTS